MFAGLGMVFPWRLRLMLLSCLAGLYFMVASLLSVTQVLYSTVVYCTLLHGGLATVCNTGAVHVKSNKNLIRS